METIEVFVYFVLAAFIAFGIGCAAHIIIEAYNEEKRQKTNET